jgi:hypothetical protein
MIVSDNLSNTGYGVQSCMSITVSSLFSRLVNNCFVFCAFHLVVQVPIISSWSVMLRVFTMVPEVLWLPRIGTMHDVFPSRYRYFALSKIRKLSLLKYTPVHLVCLVLRFHLPRRLYFPNLTSGVPHLHRPTRIAFASIEF